MNILILSCGAKYLLVDYFKNRANGFNQVVTTDCSKYAPALYKADFGYIVPRMDSKEYLPKILKICKKHNIDVVLPLQEDELILISKNIKLFQDEGIVPFVSDYDTILLCKDKLSFYKEMHHKIPNLIQTYSDKEFQSRFKTVSYPLYLKPRYGAGSAFNHIINTPHIKNMLGGVEHSLNLINTFLNEDNEYIIQPYIEGEEYGVNAYCDYHTGKLTELFIMKKLAMRAGETFKSVSLHNQNIKALVNEVVQALQFKGPIDIDIISKGEQYYILEVNPRFGGGYPLTYNCGINFPALIARNIAQPITNHTMSKYQDGIIGLRYTDIMTVHENGCRLNSPLSFA